MAKSDSTDKGQNVQDLQRQLDEARQDPARAGEVADLERRVNEAQGTTQE